MLSGIKDDVCMEIRQRKLIRKTVYYDEAKLYVQGLPIV